MMKKVVVLAVLLYLCIGSYADEVQIEEECDFAFERAVEGFEASANEALDRGLTREESIAEQRELRAAAGANVSPSNSLFNDMYPVVFLRVALERRKKQTSRSE